MMETLSIQATTLCELCCKEKSITYFCALCCCNYCDPCWPKMPPHRTGKSQIGRPHVRENKAVIEMMHEILEPPNDRRLLQRLHADDQDTRWLGVVLSNKGGASQFQDYRRYIQLMIDSRPVLGTPRYPKLISFIGDTNAGKSTLIKALISRGGLHLSPDSAGKHQAPIPGSTKNENVATSEGVHLYADPELLSSEQPMLYADCEGLNAGETPPFASELIGAMGKSGALRKPRHNVRRQEIAWTKGTDPSRSTREYAVGHLYPRFLYTFSDAIVFVQKNPKQLHLTYNYLVNWAKFNVEESINQPTLPHAIVVLNAVDIGSGDERWTVQDATEGFFRDVSKVITQHSELARLASLRDINVSSSKAARDLLNCFYSDVRVIRIPAKHPDRYSLIDEQVQQLRSMVIDAGKGSHNAKLLSRRLCDVDTLQEYLQAGFDHFAAKIDEPFDFKSVSLRKRHIAQDLSDHIVNLASAVQDGPGQRVKNKVLFQGLVPLVASCILLDIIRNNMPGSAMDYFMSHYAPLCKTALQRFCEEHVPCEFLDKKGLRCQNVKAAHVKGHQNLKGKISPGSYQSTFRAAQYEKAWITGLQERLSALEEEFNYQRTRKIESRSPVVPTISELDVAVQLHSKALAEFFAKSQGGQQCYSNISCFGCLMAIPEIPLACGHAFCSACIKENGEANNDLAVFFKCCPLHPLEPFDNEWEVSLKPEFAGIRILTLDGGGIRGIVELEILRAIESRLNLGDRRVAFIPVQRFFDLIVGTSTGGIVSLGLTVRNWTVNRCIENFKRLCVRAFTPRELDDTIFEKLATLHHGSKWKTTPLHHALQEAFNDDLIFGGRTDDSEKYASKVAVVTSSQSDGRSIVITNYNREESSDPGHTIEQSDSPTNTMRVWQAAAATSAAPSFFKPFECNGKTYLDGALNHNNPVFIAWREKKLIWPDMVTKHPDIMLSLGTGQNKVKIDAKMRRDEKVKPRRKSGEKSPVSKQNDVPHSKRYTAWNGLKNYFSVLVNKLDNILDTERTWDDFYNDIVGEYWSTEDSARYVRINPDLACDPPALDRKDLLEPLQHRVREQLTRNAALARSVEDVANRLFASSFYFRKLKISHNQNGFSCIGGICSRFEGKPAYIEQIGYFLRNQLLREFVPRFVVSQKLSPDDYDRYDTSEQYEFPLEKALIDDIITRKVFYFGREFEVSVAHRDEPTYICLRLRREDARGKVLFKDYPISGFPRRFHVEEERNAARLQKHKNDVLRVKSQKKAVSSPPMGKLIDHLSPTINLTSSRSSSHLRKTGSGSSARPAAAPTSPPPLSDDLSDSGNDTDTEFSKRTRALDLSAEETELVFSHWEN